MWERRLAGGQVSTCERILKTSRCESKKRLFFFKINNKYWTKVKVKVTLEQANKAKRESRGMALLFL